MTSLISGIFSNKNIGSIASGKSSGQSADDEFESEFEFESETALLAVPAMIDWKLLVAIVGLVMFGLVMITSASMPFAAKNYGDPFFFVVRQCIYTGIGLVLALMVFNIPTRQLERYGPMLLLFSMFLLALVLVPGLGKTVNGSQRWLALGPVNVQVSEAVKLFIIIYLAGYLVRRVEMVRSSLKGFMMPMLLISIADLLLLSEPDFGAAVIITATAVVMLFVAGVKWRQFGLLLFGLSVVGVLLILLEPYRAERMSSFLSPFDDPFGAGFQLTQSLIAIGSGSWFGVGLGSSVQKLFYLPEAHTDFVFAILSEELGLVGSLAVIAIYIFLLWRSYLISRTAYALGNHFSAYVALGIGTWLGLQSFVNIGVNVGLLPTKGITLPMLSYGGSSALIFSLAFAVLLRIDYENRLHSRESMKPSRREQVRRAGRVYA